MRIMFSSARAGCQAIPAARSASLGPASRRDLVRPLITAAALLAATALAVAGCGRAARPAGPVASGSASAGTGSVASGQFGRLSGVCQPGKASGATGQGVTSGQITVGVLTDQAFTKIPDLVNAAQVFTDWCNAAGGIDGRKLAFNVGQTKLLQVVQAMSASCATDFALVGNSEALDGLAVNTRVKCLEPEFPAQIVMPQNVNSALQAYPLVEGHSFAPYSGY